MALTGSSYTVNTRDRVEGVEVEHGARGYVGSLGGPGLEHLRLVASNDGAVANGLVIGLEAGRPLRIGYEVRCDGR